MPGLDQFPHSPPGGVSDTTAFLVSPWMPLAAGKALWELRFGSFLSLLHERDVRGGNPFPRWPHDNRRGKIGHQPLECQYVAGILALFAHQEVVVHLDLEGLEPVVVREKKEQAGQVLCR